MSKGRLGGPTHVFGGIAVLLSTLMFGLLPTLDMTDGTVQAMVFIIFVELIYIAYQLHKRYRKPKA